jgi:hypothetical protein
MTLRESSDRYDKLPDLPQEDVNIQLAWRTTQVVASKIASEAQRSTNAAFARAWGKFFVIGTLGWRSPSARPC